MKNNYWISVHLFYLEPWETFLTKAVNTFVNKVFDKKLAKQFFFIRYWEKGAHIRLRFRGNKQLLENELKPLLIKHFEAYFKKHPTEFEEVKTMEKIAKTHNWFPNNSIQFIKYEPEVERYGGSYGLIISEEYFQVSSIAVLAAINDCKEWNYDVAMGYAIQMHLGFAFGVGMNLKESLFFYSSVLEKWFPNAFYYNKKMTKEVANKLHHDTYIAFEENFQQQKEYLIPFFKTILNALKNEFVFEQEWMNVWIKEASKLKDKIIKIQKSKKLIVPSNFVFVPNINISEVRQKRWSIYESYVHMTNNRLGILNKDEAFLGYLIKKCLESIKNKS